MANYKISAAAAAPTYTGAVNGTMISGGTQARTGFNVRDNADISTARISHGSITPGSGAITGIRPATTATGALFNQVQKDHYVGPYITDGTLAGVAKTTHNTPASDYGRRGIHRQVTARRIDISGWNYLTGAATFGGNRGAVYTQYAPQGGTVDDASNPTIGVPGELVYGYGAASGAVLADYASRKQVK